ncbi:MAG: hypothetical protein HYU36_22920 [Planctomycetes bacterium]|nr:hypothetical protein [Planctomycetota bacterium]
MTSPLPIHFPSESEQIRQQAQAERLLSPAQRFRALLDALAAAERMSNAGGCRPAQLRYHQRCEEEWQRFMKQFIAQHAASGTP